MPSPARIVVAEMERFQCWAVSDVFTGEKLMSGLSSAQSAHSWALCRGYRLILDEELVETLLRIGSRVVGSPRDPA